MISSRERHCLHTFECAYLSFLRQENFRLFRLLTVSTDARVQALPPFSQGAAAVHGPIPTCSFACLRQTAPHIDGTALLTPRPHSGLRGQLEALLARGGLNQR